MRIRSHWAFSDSISASGHRSGGYESLWGHWYPCLGLVVTSALGIKARVDSLTCMLHHLCAMDSQDWPLVWHLLTSWQPVCQPNRFNPQTGVMHSWGSSPGTRMLLPHSMWQDRRSIDWAKSVRRPLSIDVNTALVYSIFPTTLQQYNCSRSQNMFTILRHTVTLAEVLSSKCLYTFCTVRSGETADDIQMTRPGAFLNSQFQSINIC